MRVYLIWFATIFLCVYSWKDWYKALCALLIMLAIVERPDMPKTVLGIPGLNPWNLIFINVVFSCVIATLKDSSTIKSAKDFKIHFLFYIYLVSVLILTFRGFAHINEINVWRNIYGGSITIKDLVIDDIFNTLKYIVVAYLFYIGANTKEKISLGIISVLLLNVLLAIQVIKWMPISALVDGDLLQRRSMRVLDREIGYYRSDLAVLLGGAAWAFFTIKNLVRNNFFYYSSLFGSLLSTLATALTGSRIGMGVWLAVALILAWYKWRHFLFLAPVALAIILTSVPAIQERLTQGLNPDEQENTDYSDHVSSMDSDINTASVTSGRTIIWPFVVDEILQAPWSGHGKHAMQSTGLAETLLMEHGELFPHPHNAYLELLLDGGIIIAAPILLFFYFIIKMSISLVKDKNDELRVSVGGVTLAFVVGQLIGCLAGQSFYPMISQISMWVMIFISIRLSEIKQEAAPTEEHPSPSIERKQFYRSLY